MTKESFIELIYEVNGFKDGEAEFDAISDSLPEELIQQTNDNIKNLSFTMRGVDIMTRWPKANLSGFNPCNKYRVALLYDEYITAIHINGTRVMLERIKTDNSVKCGFQYEELSANAYNHTTGVNVKKLHDYFHKHCENCIYMHEICMFGEGE